MVKTGLKGEDMNMETNRIATLTLDDGRTMELPILSGTLGPDVIDIRNLGKVGLFTYDPGILLDL
jgi:citrate synthase